jgi:hypothetical protein
LKACCESWAHELTLGVSEPQEVDKVLDFRLLVRRQLANLLDQLFFFEARGLH